MVPATSFATAAAPPPPPPVLLLEEDEDEDEDAAETVTLFVPVAVPPGVPEADSENEHVAADEGAVTLQLTELVPEPAMVPTVFVSDATVHWLLVSVAVTPVVEPAVSVPPFAIVAETVNVELVSTDEGALMDATLNSAAELTVTVPQSAVHVEPSATQTSWPPVTVGVMEKSAVPVPPAWMLAIVVLDDEAVNHEPCSCAAKLVTACDCLFVIVTVNVADVLFVSVPVLLEHEYWLSVLQTFVQAANAGTASIDASTMAITITLLFIFYLPSIFISLPIHLN